ncbi:DUF4136 domain-containing protein, partial [Cytophagia bacterium CHB2]|nr:DUF4136 domain-containing protein [Cytophagia bacterium CHB2]
NNAGSAVGRGGTILTTTNGGATWVPRTSGTTQVLNAVQIINTTTAVAVGNGGVILKTTDGGANFAQYKTFDFMSKRAKPTANPLAEKRVETAVEQQLIAKGYEKQTSGRPDFFVVCHANVRDKIDVDTYGYRYGRYGRRIGTYTTVREYQHGTLVVDFVDANTKELFWRGWAKGEVNDAIAKEKIDDTIAKILAKYPPQ